MFFGNFQYENIGSRTASKTQHQRNQNTASSPATKYMQQHNRPQFQNPKYKDPISHQIKSNTAQNNNNFTKAAQAYAHKLLNQSYIRDHLNAKITNNQKNSNNASGYYFTGPQNIPQLYNTTHPNTSAHNLNSSNISNVRPPLFIKNTVKQYQEQQRITQYKRTANQYQQNKSFHGSDASFTKQNQQSPKLGYNKSLTSFHNRNIEYLRNTTGVKQFTTQNNSDVSSNNNHNSSKYEKNVKVQHENMTNMYLKQQMRPVSPVPNSSECTNYGSNSHIIVNDSNVDKHRYLVDKIQLKSQLQKIQQKHAKLQYDHYILKSKYEIQSKKKYQNTNYNEWIKGDSSAYSKTSNKLGANNYNITNKKQSTLNDNSCNTPYNSISGSSNTGDSDQLIKNMQEQLNVRKEQISKLEQKINTLNRIHSNSNSDMKHAGTSNQLQQQYVKICKLYEQSRYQSIAMQKQSDQLQQQRDRAIRQCASLKQQLNKSQNSNNSYANINELQNNNPLCFNSHKTKLGFSRKNTRNLRFNTDQPQNRNIIDKKCELKEQKIQQTGGQRVGKVLEKQIQVEHNAYYTYNRQNTSKSTQQMMLKLENTVKQMETDREQLRQKVTTLMIQNERLQISSRKYAQKSEQLYTVAIQKDLQMEAMKTKYRKQSIYRDSQQLQADNAKVKQQRQQAAIQRQSTHIQQLTKQLQQIKRCTNGEIQQKQKQLKILLQSNNELLQTKNQLMQSKNVLYKANLSLLSQKQLLESQKQLNNQQISRLKSDLKKYKQKIIQLESTNVKHYLSTQQYTKLQQQHAQLQHQYADEQKQHNRLQQEYSSLQRQNSKIQLKINKLQQQHKKQGQKQNDMLEKYSSLLQRYRDSQHNQSAANQLAQQKYYKLEQQLEDMQQKYSQLQLQLLCEKQSMSHLHSRQQLHKKQLQLIDQCKDRMHKLEQQLQLKDSQIQQLSDKLQRNQQQMKIVAEQFNNQRQRLQSLVLIEQQKCQKYDQALSEKEQQTSKLKLQLQQHNQSMQKQNSIDTVHGNLIQSQVFVSQSTDLHDCCQQQITNLRSIIDSQAIIINNQQTVQNQHILQQKKYRVSLSQKQDRNAQIQQQLSVLSEQLSQLKEQLGQRIIMKQRGDMQHGGRYNQGSGLIDKNSTKLRLKLDMRVKKDSAVSSTSLTESKQLLCSSNNYECRQKQLATSYQRLQKLEAGILSSQNLHQLSQSDRQHHSMNKNQSEQPSKQEQGQQYIEIDINVLYYLCQLLAIQPQQGQLLNQIVTEIQHRNHDSTMITNFYVEILDLFGIGDTSCIQIPTDSINSSSSMLRSSSKVSVRQTLTLNCHVHDELMKQIKIFQQNLGIMLQKTKQLEIWNEGLLKENHKLQKNIKKLQKQCNSMTNKVMNKSVYQIMIDQLNQIVVNYQIGGLNNKILRSRIDKQQQQQADEQHGMSVDMKGEHESNNNAYEQI